MVFICLSKCYNSPTAVFILHFFREVTLTKFAIDLYRVWR